MKRYDFEKLLTPSIFALSEEEARMELANLYPLEDVEEFELVDVVEEADDD